MRLLVGMKVRMSKRGRDKWYDSDSNPHNTFGRVQYVAQQDEIFGEEDVDWEDNSDENWFPYSVVWDTGHENSYRYGDLDVTPPTVTSLKEYI